MPRLIILLKTYPRPSLDGKTTSAINIAAFLAITETPTLLIDMDPQCNATSGVGVEIGSYKKSIYDVIIGNAKISAAIKKTKLEFLDIIPSSAQLAGSRWRRLARHAVAVCVLVTLSVGY